MKNHYSFFIIIYITCVATCNAMEKQLDKSNIIKEITSVKNPHYVQYLENDRLMIAGDGCRIINMRTNEEKNINDEIFTCRYSFYLGARQDKKKIALNINNTVTIYDVETGKAEWSRKGEGDIRYVRFNLFEPTIFVCYDHFERNNYLQPSVMMQCNYVTNHCEDSRLVRSNDNCIALHPTQPIMCVINNTEKTIFAYNLKDLGKNSILKRKLYSFTGHYFLGDYSPDGSLFAAGRSESILVMNSNSGLSVAPYLEKKDECFLRMAFLNNKVLATLSRKRFMQEFFIHYWDIAARTIMCTSPLLNVNHAKNFYAWNFSFSSKKTEVAVALGDRCVILPVPFEVIYESEIKEKFPHYLFLLNQLKQQEDLPNDVVQCFKNILLQTFKR